MAPYLFSLLARGDDPSSFDPAATTDQLRAQWALPADILSVLLILGGDVVASALAQLAGQGLTPVAFSFGWVSYSITALVATFGENKLMPQMPPSACKLIHGRSGYVRTNSSWILARIMRDFEHWRDDKTRSKTNEVLDTRWKELRARNPDISRPVRAGLVVTVYTPSKTRAAGVPVRDYVYWSGIATLVVQLGVAAIPCALYGDWGVLLITAGGSMLALATGLLPQWAREKWACRTGAKASYVLTRGNGGQHAIVVLGNGHGLDLEDLAAGQENVEVAASWATRSALLFLAAMWLALLVCSAGMRTHTWFLLAVGAGGILQNVFVAGWARRPENFGVPLDFVEVIGYPKVMDALLEVENKYPYVGRSMRDEFFPGTLSKVELKRWEEIDEKWRDK